MIWRSVREWGGIQISDVSGNNAIMRAQANQLLSLARSSQASPRRAEVGSERILIERQQQLRAQQVVGVLAAPDLYLEILPKIDGADTGATRRNLISMLARVLDLDIASGALAPLTWQHQNMLEIIIRLFSENCLGPFIVG